MSTVEIPLNHYTYKFRGLGFPHEFAVSSPGTDVFLRQTEIELTELERDHLLQIVYTSNFPYDVPELHSAIGSWLFSIAATGKTVEERYAEQTALASSESRAYVAKLKSGEVAPISRTSEPGDPETMSEEEKVAQETRRTATPRPSNSTRTK